MVFIRYDAMLRHGHDTTGTPGCGGIGSAPVRGRAAVCAGAGQAAVMRALGVSRQTAHQWYHRWRRGGRQGLNAVGRLGRKPRLDQRQLGRVERALLQGPRRHGFATELWTLPRVAMVIARLTGVHYHPGHVWYLLRGLQWSLQRPARRARERD